MLYVLGEILVWAVAFTLLGLLLGWIVWGWRSERQSPVNPAASSIQGLRNEVAKRDRRIAELEAGVRGAHDRCAELEAEVADTTRRLEEARGAADTAERAAVAARNEAGSLRANLSVLEERLMGTEDELVDLRRRSDADVEALRSKIDGRDRAISDLQIRLAAVDLGNGTPEPDDLKQISGVGRVLEEMLHDAGITTFRQLAELSDADVADLDDKLAEFHGRIRREGWIEQARTLHQAKYGAADAG
jgi:predicted flap endonuclease-1-like 5' DNA nuclease